MANKSIPASVPVVKDQEVIAKALQILESRLRKPGAVVATADNARDFLRLQLSNKYQEVFAVLFLDTRHRVIEYQELFFGTIDGAAVHPREVVRQALEHNAAAVILAHNHPSGVAEPSKADKTITERLKSALALIDVRVLDHLIIGSPDTVSFAERGLL